MAMRFRNFGGIYQFQITNEEDLAKIDVLDPARWAATSAPLHDLHCDADKIGRQYKDADGRGIPCVALVGPDEVARGTVSLKDLKSGDRADVPRAEAAAWVRSKLAAR